MVASTFLPDLSPWAPLRPSPDLVPPNSAFARASAVVARSLSVVAAVRASEASGTVARAFPSSAADTTAGARVRARLRATRVAASERRMCRVS